MTVLDITISAIFESFRSVKNILQNNKVDFNLFFIETKINNIAFRSVEQKEEKTIYKFKVNYLFELQELTNKKIILSRFLNIDSNQIIIEQINYYVYITAINVNNSYVYDYNIHTADKFNLLLGYDIENKPIRFNISKPSNSHIGIFASTRGGKSNLMYLLLCQLIQFGRMDIELDIINPKIVDFYEFEHVKNVKNYTEDTDQALEILLENIELMNHRYNTFKRNNVKSLEQYRKINKMPYKMIVIDEVATFQGDKEFHNALTILANKSAGAGIILILSSQLLNKDIMTNQVRQNLNTTFGGKCKDKVKSDMIYENSNLHLDIKRVGQFKIYDNFNNGALTQILEVKNHTISELCNRNKKVARASHSNNLSGKIMYVK